MSLMIAEQGVDHRTAGIVHPGQQRERRRLVPEPRVMTAVHLDQHALPGHALAAHPVLGRTPSPRTAQTGVRMRRRVVLPMSMPSRSLSKSLRWVWLAPAYLVRAKHALRRPPRHRALCCLACGPGGHERRRQRPSLDKPLGCAWCGEW